MNQMKLYYTKPAGCWEECLPIGNGSLGAMILGGVGEDVLGLNEETLWSGYYHDKNNPAAYDSLEKVRKLVFAGKNKEAERLIQNTMLGEFNETYLPMGNLKIRYAGEAEASGYGRTLDLDSAVANISYEMDGVRYEREYFASYPAKAIFIRLKASLPAISAEISFASQLMCRMRADETGIAIAGKCPEHVDPSYVPDREGGVIFGDKGMDFDARIGLLFCDGKVTGQDGILKIENASECILTVSAVKKAMLPEGEDGRSVYEKAREEHITDYCSLYDRVELYLGEQSELPTDERLEAVKSGGQDNGLYALLFQYGRYLLIASSRPGSLPANLQGIWNWEFRAPWSSNWTININTQMNYWPALSCRLTECLEPYVRFMEEVCEEGKKTAAVNYHCRGFVAHHNLDYWKNTSPVGLIPGETAGGDGSVNWAFWTMGGAWLTQELYRLWEYENDREYLEQKAFPIIREAALFLNDWLVEHEGMYVTCPSNSPENCFRLPDGQTTCLTYASSMDMAIVREVFGNYEKMCEILGVEDELLSDIRKKQPRLAPFLTGSFGQLLEWYEEYEENEPGHRHVSHLYGLFPSELFAGNEALEKACRTSLDYRLEHGGGHTGWSCAWIINLFAVLKDGEKVYEYLRTLLCRSTYPNLWDAHPPFQIDGNFGGTAGIANMLVQDRGGEITVLPALPKAFADGWVKGLALKSKKAIDIEWKDGKEVFHRIYDRA